MQAAMSLVGVATILGIAYLMSSNRGAIRIRTVGIAFAIQATVAASKASASRSRSMFCP